MLVEYGRAIRELDELDKQIIAQLQMQGIQKYARIAQSLGVGERTIRRRIDKLISSDAVKVIAVLNPVQCGFRAWTEIGIKIEPRYLGQVASSLVEHPSVYFVANALGRYDIILGAHFNTIDSLTYFVTSELFAVKGIENAETWILAYPRKYFHFSWPAPSFEKTRDPWEPYREATVSQKRYQLGEVDHKILSLLREDGRATPVSLKEKLHLGESTIRKRMRTLQEHEAYKLEVVPNPRILEYEAWATIGININNQYAHEVIDAIVKNPAVYLAAVALGRFNIITTCRFPHPDALNRFVTEELTSIPGIASSETFLHNRPIKYHNLNWSNIWLDKAGV